MVCAIEKTEIWRGCQTRKSIFVKFFRLTECHAERLHEGIEHFFMSGIDFFGL
jgi:hypothetical protein